jgi:hypothetical protein
LSTTTPYEPKTVLHSYPCTSKYVSTKMITRTINSQVTYPGAAVDAEFQATGLDSSDERFGLRKVPGGAVVPLQDRHHQLKFVL